MEVKKICVLGVGTIGYQIAFQAAMSGYPTVLRDIEEGIVDRGLRTIEQIIDKFYVQKNKMTSSEAKGVLNRIQGTTNLKEGVHDVDLVFESIPPDLELKRRVLKELDETCPPKTILASNTSNMSINAISSLIIRKDKMIGTHFFNPVQVMRLIEVVKGAHTSDETLETIKDVAKRMNKEIVVINDFPGFIVSRIFNVLINEAIKIYSQGIASAEDIDKAISLGLNHPHGPMRLADINLEVNLAGLEYMQKELGDEYRPCPEIKRRVHAGLVGRKSGKGFYNYE